MTSAANPSDRQAGDSAALGSRLCTECGLCCTGAIHDTARLDPDEVEAAADLGLPVLDRDDPAFSLPCPKLAGTACSIYGSRPRVCGRYRCQLLQDVEAGKTDLSEALALVRTAQQLMAAARSAVTDTLAKARYRARHRALPELLAGTAAADRPAIAAEKLRVTALDLFLDKHFRNARDIRMYRTRGKPPIK